MESSSQSGAAKLVYAAFLLLAIAITWLFLGSLPLPAGGWIEHKWPSDLVRYYYPVARYQGEMLANGELPFWNPWQLAGFPLLAAPAAGILYPPLLILTPLVPAELALQIHAIGHLFLGAWFLWLLLGRLGASPLAATIGALAFGISDEILRITELTSFMSTVAWIPGIFWAILALIDEPRFRRAVILGAVLALGFLGGHGQGLLYAIYWAIPFGCAALLWRAPDARTRIQVLGWLFPAAIFTLLLSAPQLLPSLELMFDGSRSQEPLTPRQAAMGSQPWRRLWAIFSAPDSPGYLFGYPTLLLCLCGLLGKTSRWAKLTIGALSILALLYILGRATPVWWFFYEMPLGKSFRNPMRIGPILVFLVSILVGFGCQNLMDLAARWRPGRHAGNLLAGFLALILMGDALTFGPPLEQYKQLRDMEFWGSRDLPRSPPEETDYQRSLLLEGLRFGDLNRQIKSGMVHRRMIVGDYEPILPQPYLDLLDKQSLWHGRMGLGRDRLGVMDSPPEYSRLLNLMGVRETITFTKMAAYASSREAKARHERVGDTWSVKRKHALPRTFVVHETLVDPDPATTRARILSADFRPLQEAVVATGPALQKAKPPRPGSARITRYEPDRVEIETLCYESCLLVLTDLFYPGWEASANGKSVPIVKTDLAFRGVNLAPGQYQVEFRYRPASFRIGAWLFGFGITALALGLWRGRRSKTE